MCRPRLPLPDQQKRIVISPYPGPGLDGACFGTSRNEQNPNGATGRRKRRSITDHLKERHC